ncbi:MAG TPA: hypothetical protein VFY84_17525 [Jiangellales bacterium]|nr:hypothetical protein [Jiangellales bacterium]
MADIVSDGRTRVYWVTTIASIASPTVAELNAGLALQDLLTADGLIGFQPVQAKIDSTPLSGTFNTTRNGRVSFGDTRLRFKKQDTSDTIFNTLIKDAAGYVVIRRSILVTTAWTASQTPVSVYPAVCGETVFVDPEENSLERFEVPIGITSTPNQRATVA